MNDKNLIPNSERSPSEVRENGRKGGIASGKARRKKRDMREAAKVLLDTEVKNPRVRRKMKDNGIEDNDLTNQMAVLLSMFMSAVNGNVRAAEFLRDTAGYNPSEMLKQETNEIEDISAIRKAVYGDDS